MTNLNTIENWTVILKHATKDKPATHVLVGVNFAGRDMTTSHILGKRDGLVVCDDGNSWELLEPNADYEKIWPNARALFLQYLPEV